MIGWRWKRQPGKRRPRSRRFDRSFALGTAGTYLAVLVALALLDTVVRFGLVLNRFATEDGERAEDAARELASDVREIMINRGGPVAARTIYPILDRTYRDAGLHIGVEPSEITRRSIKRSFGFEPRGLPADWPEGRFREGSVPLRAEELCLQCHVGAEVGDVLGTVTARRYFSARLASFWQDSQVLALVAMVNVIVATGAMFVMLRRRMRPVQALDETMSDLASSEVALGGRVPVESRDEFGKLAHDTNLFLGRVGRAAEDLEALARDLGDLEKRIGTVRREGLEPLVDGWQAEVAASRRCLIELLANLHEDCELRSAGPVAATALEPGALAWPETGGLRCGGHPAIVPGRVLGPARVGRNRVSLRPRGPCPAPAPVRRRTTARSGRVTG